MEPLKNKYRSKVHGIWEDLQGEKPITLLHEACEVLEDVEGAALYALNKILEQMIDLNNEEKKRAKELHSYNIGLKKAYDIVREAFSDVLK